VKKVKVMRQRGRTRLSAKNQATIPVEALRRAGLRPGDELLVEAAGAGRIVLARSEDLIARHAGALTGVYPRGYLRQLRREWR
jgi:bifunctional DNA-binding transcriptional regulator/antitoxin component of YhaV-PrlF toxin-antitoxin module